MKDRKNLKLITASLLTVILILLAVFPGGELFQNKFSPNIMLDRQNVWGFYDLPKNSIDVYISGSSQIISGVSSPELYKDHGITAYGLGTCSQPVRVACYWLKEMLEYQSPKVFLYEVSGLYYKDKNEGSHARALVDMKNTSKNKYDAVKEVTEGKLEDMLGYYWSMYRYHDRWSELSKDDYLFADGTVKESYAGFAITKGSDSNSYTRDDYVVSYSDSKNQITEQSYLAYLGEMKEICDEKDIAMVLFKTPREDWTDESYSAIADIAETLGVDYIDLNEAQKFDSLSLDLENDYFDHKHLNVHGAKKVTSFVAKYLKENFDLGDHRNTNHYYDELCAEYDEAMKTAMFSEVESFAECREYIGNANYSYVLSKKGKLNFSEEDMEVLSDMGVGVGITEFNNYVFVKSKGKVLAEHASNGSIEIRDFTFGGNYYLGKVNSNEITARFEDASKKVTVPEGLVLSVFDNSTGFAVCSLVFDSELER